MNHGISTAQLTAHRGYLEPCRLCLGGNIRHANRDLDRLYILESNRSTWILNMLPGCHRLSLCLFVTALLVQKQCRQNNHLLTRDTWTSLLSNEQQKHKHLVPKQKNNNTSACQDTQSALHFAKGISQVKLMRGTRRVCMELMDWYRYSSQSAAKSRTGNEQLMVIFLRCASK